MTDLVRYALEGNVAVLTVNNPPVNALAIGVRTGLIEGIERAIADHGAEAIALVCEGVAGWQTTKAKREPCWNRGEQRGPSCVGLGV